MEHRHDDSKHSEKDCKVMALRKAIMEELDATNTYTKLGELFPDKADIIDEIKHDEINHTGRLIDMLFELVPDQFEYFQKGLKQED